MKNITGVSDLESLQNTTLLSDWWTITQEMIDRFADAAFDHQWIHVDPKRASTESPFGTTIAHGFLTLSLLSPMLKQCIVSEGAVIVNYGFDRVRFPHPVRCGDRIRGSFLLSHVGLSAVHVDLLWTVEVKAEGAPKPSLAALWLSRVFFSQQTP